MGRRRATRMRPGESLGLETTARTDGTGICFSPVNHGYVRVCVPVLLLLLLPSSRCVVHPLSLIVYTMSCRGAQRRIYATNGKGDDGGGASLIDLPERNKSQTAKEQACLDGWAEGEAVPPWETVQATYGSVCIWLQVRAYVYRAA